MSPHREGRSSIGDSFFSLISGAMALIIACAIVLGLPLLFSLAASTSGANEKLNQADEPVLPHGQTIDSAESAQQWLRLWADALPENSANHGRSTSIEVVTDSANPRLWSVRTTLGQHAVPVLGWAGISWPSLDALPPIDKFRCVVITSANPEPIIYPVYEKHGLFDDEKGCDGNAAEVRTVDPRFGDRALDPDGDELASARATETGRANPYLTADTLRTAVAQYSVQGSEVVSNTETRLEVLQTASATGQLSCQDLGTKRCEDPRARTQRRTVVVSTGQAGTGPVTVLEPKENR